LAFLLSCSVQERDSSQSQVFTSKLDTLRLPSDYLPDEIFSLIREPSVLIALEQKGFHIGHLLGHHQVEAPIFADRLYRENSIYQRLTDDLIEDLEVTLEFEQTFDSTRGRIGYDKPRGKPNRRVFPKGWLKAKNAHFELVGIINRLDRISFDPGSCGELRFIYRLAYQDGDGSDPLRSRLPLTVMLKYRVLGKPDSWHNSDCKRFLNQWIYPRDPLTPVELVSWMVGESGPLAGNIFAKENLWSIEVNLQSVRIPSGARPDFAGQGDYFLRAYLLTDEKKLIPAPLENTPDVLRIKNDRDLKQKLVNFLNQPGNIARLNAGILKIPDEYLATKASSFSAYGISRLSNRPWSQVLTPADFATESFQNFLDQPHPQDTFYVRSADAAIRRLNDLSCVGCHQGRATAGFHFLGIDRASTHEVNALVFEGSGHFSNELTRRKAYLNRIRHGLVPKPHRDFSIAPPEGQKATVGHYCGLPGSHDFSHWQCSDGLKCVAYDEIEGEKSLGKCVPDGPLLSGDYCRSGEVQQPTNQLDQWVKGPPPFHNIDQLKNSKEQKCGDTKTASSFRCRPHGLGHPGGNCARACNKLVAGREVCGSHVGSGFTDCISSGRKNFTECILDAAQPGARGACNETMPCRNDYVCSRVPNSVYGACMPSYFVFQLRLDGHPSPKF
jgi:hypothetical protein